uniref:Uncharacterized protein n=1 Tax=Arundo donax TaxID=35708 RepID=A0A0A9FU55_ARUDO
MLLHFLRNGGPKSH